MWPVLPIVAGLVVGLGPLGAPGAQAQGGPSSEQARSSLEQARAALMSAVFPGSGQYAMGQRRAWAYFALEAVGWAAWIDRRSAASDFRARYKAFAWEEGRVSAGARIDGDFDYYERLSKWARSGAFDADAGAAGVQPEMDTSTYNGSIWALAARLFLPGGPAVPESDPQYQRALDYYRERAYGPEFLWDWTGTGTAQQEYGSLIRASDDRFRQATNALGLVLVNRLVSVFDAYVSARAPGTTLSSAVSPTRHGSPIWSARLDVALPW